MNSRSRLGVLLIPLVSVLTGCGDTFHAGPMSYVESEKVATELKGKPKLQKAVRKALADLYGPEPRRIKVPADSGFYEGGRRLANYIETTDSSGKGVIRPIVAQKVEGGNPLFDESGKPLRGDRQEGGYGLYRKHCLHCHGVSGAGDGPTAQFLYPRPRDYRKGLFKFTSTPNGAKPSRADLRKTLKYGLHGTSMPAFEALMSDDETEQVLDYMTFLSIRGETELALVDEAALVDEETITGDLPADVVADVSKAVLTKWSSAESQVVNPPVPKPPSTKESVLRGKALFLGINKTGNKVDCTSCHGPQALGNGPSFVGQDVFNDVVFGGDPDTMPDRLARYDAKTRELWKNSLDEWGNPLRPNNLNRGVYKGGRRPIDIYWRIAKGINGAKMPAHYPTIEPERIWDLVNFVLELPFEPDLLDGATLPSAPPPPLQPPAVANR